MERHVTISSNKRTKHINAIYHFIKDQIEINVIYCYTDIMVANYLTKLLQRLLFIHFRDAIMGMKYFDSLTKERVDETLHNNSAKSTNKEFMVN